MQKEERIQKFLHRVRFEDLSLEYLRSLIKLARDEDLEGAGLAEPAKAGGDVTSELLAQSGNGRATLHARETLVVCGLPLIPIVLEAYSEELSFEPALEDGVSADAGDALGTLKGPVDKLLMAEVRPRV